MTPWKSEFDFERFLRRMRFGSRAVPVGIGDDAAVLPRGRGRLLFTTDMMVENIHFRRDSSPPEWLAYKLLARNVSDIAAMGGTPTHYVVSLAIPDDLPADFFPRFYRGLKKAQKRMRARLVGGDLSRSACGILFGSLALLGETEGAPLLRRGARVRDSLWVTGLLGRSAAALELLETSQARVESTPPQFRFKRGLSAGRRRAMREILRAHFLPEPRLAAGRRLVKHRMATAAIDISDGLSTDLNRLCEASSVGAVIHLKDLPIARSLALCVQDPLSCVLHGGEDYELLFSAPASASARLARSFGQSLYRIGEVVSRKEGVRIEEGGKLRPLASNGYDHLRR
ncbi:MAG: thiamine-phosphate kinase [Acidobacteria bacterium]|nr:thiamine-phosphate kinase [Acidobacteriota bacterium]